MTQELVRGERDPSELPNRQDRAHERERWNDRVHSRSIREASVHHRRCLVAASAERGDDALDHSDDVVIVGKGDVGEVEFALALDPHLMRAVHHDLGDAVVVE